MVFSLCADVSALPKHLSNRHLLMAGVEANGIVDSKVIRAYKPGKSSTEAYEITVCYHFTAQDGRRYEGSSKIDTRDPLLVANGMRIPILYNPTDPNRSGWAMGLEQAISGFYMLPVMTGIVWLWLGLFVCRYIPWRSSSPKKHATKNHSLLKPVLPSH